jgi:hypothetical protein
MATHSYAAAAMTLYDTLTASLFPSSTRSPIYFGKAPQATSAGQRRHPYVVLEDEGSTPEYQSDAGGPESGAFTLTVVADTLADVDRIVAAVKWNGLAPSSKAGFDEGALTLDNPLYHLSLRRTKEVRSYEADGKDGPRVHRCVLSYAVEFGIAPGLTPA